MPIATTQRVLATSDLPSMPKEDILSPLRHKKATEYHATRARTRGAALCMPIEARIHADGEEDKASEVDRSLHISDKEAEVIADQDSAFD